MADEAATYLTVREAAERLRMAPQTVYRWCRAGRLPALKIGKEWRIPTGELERSADPLGLQPLETILEELAARSEHLVAMAGTKADLARMQAAFFDVGARRGSHLVYARWAGDDLAAGQSQQFVVRGARGKRPSLHLLTLKDAYEGQKLAVVQRLLMNEIAKAQSKGVPCHIYCSSYSYFGYHFEPLIAFERELHKRMAGQASLCLCGYALEDFVPLYAGRALSVLLELMNCHSGVLWFEGQRALLCRPGTGA